MTKFRIKVQVKGLTAVYTPQRRYFFIGWCNFEITSLSDIRGYRVTFDNEEEAKQFIQEQKENEVTKTYYL